MGHEIIRIGVYWFPPKELKEFIERTWAGKLNNYKACELVARHAGDCPIWGAHATLLDAISILAEDRGKFITSIQGILKEFLPITLNEPDIKEWGWGDNVFLRWRKDVERKKLKSLRKKLLKIAREFVIVEQISWEAVNELDRLIKCFGANQYPKFQEGFDELKVKVLPTGLKLIHAPNIPLDWYVRNLANNKKVSEKKLPFPPSPHISIATAVRYDDVYGMTASKVGNYIKSELKNVPGCNGILGNNIKHIVDSAYIVEPEDSKNEPMEVTVIDRITGNPRNELRQRWVPKERLF